MSQDIEGLGRVISDPNPTFLERAWAAIAATAAASNVGIVLGTERVVGDALLISALVINRDGTVAGSRTKFNSTRLRMRSTRQASNGIYFELAR